MGEHTAKDIYGNDVWPYWEHPPDSGTITYKILVDGSFAGLNEHLGKIVVRHDGRFDWFRYDTRYYQGQWSGRAQGVNKTVAEAIAKLEEGWVK